MILTLAAAAALTASLTACTRDVTEPAVDRHAAPGTKSASLFSGSSFVWAGSIVAIESRQLNSAGQTVCLDIPFGNAYSGQNVNYYPCHYGPSQQFRISGWDAGYGMSWVTITPASNPNVCFDIRGGTTFGGEHLQLFTCKALGGASAQNQIFLIPDLAVDTGWPLTTTICVSNGYPNLVLDVPLPTTVSSYVQQFQLNGGANQLWRFRNVSSGTYVQGASGYAHAGC
jgi:hypothetical protein